MMHFSNLEAFYIGALQGVTEFLPVSSSAHLIIYSYFKNGNQLPMYYNVALHFGTALALLFYFWKDWLDFGKAFSRKRTKENSKHRKLFFNVVFASIPPGFFGFLLRDKIESELHSVMIVVLPLALFGFVLWYVDKKRPKTKRLEELSGKEAFLLGFWQSLALLPGVSRSAASITGGRFLCLKREDAIRFSFLIGTPLMIAASLLHVKEFYLSINEPQFYIGFLSSFALGLISIHFFLRFLSQFGFLSFALYRLVLASYLYFIIF
jgi:undecaprenyl-diphosphatase